mgnify:CR=1 FL=1
MKPHWHIPPPPDPAPPNHQVLFPLLILLDGLDMESTEACRQGSLCAELQFCLFPSGSGVRRRAPALGLPRCLMMTDYSFSFRLLPENRIGAHPDSRPWKQKGAGSGVFGPSSRAGKVSSPGYPGTYSTSRIISSSTQAFRGSSDTPTANRVCFPLSPNTRVRTSDAPSRTLAES